jgi:endonuclease/exonuclease/phosphatase family metal-dependent hydrolase
VPTYHRNKQTPATATRQLDFVFVSAGVAERVRARALNEAHEWGPSDHCCVEIELA